MTEQTCKHCIHFNDDPEFIEAQFPGINALGSAYGSTRGPAGICRELGRFMDPMPAKLCPSFTPQTQESRGCPSTGSGQAHGSG